jgi:hypothetical protein
MNPHNLFHTTGRLMGLALLFTTLHAAAQQPLPGLVGNLSFQQGAVSFSPAGDENWYQADPGRPLASGDRLWTDRDSRAEVFIGASAVRLDEQSDLAFSSLGNDAIQLTTTQGALQVRVRDESASPPFEIGTANAAIVIQAPGDYRIDTEPGNDTTHIAVAAGSVAVFGDGGESFLLQANQQVTVTGRHLAAAPIAPPRAGATAFEYWVAERNRIDDESVSARYVSREVPGYQQLDAYGNWQSDPTYGQVWYPNNVAAGWAPYQSGRWVDIAPWGWTWIDAAPWGFAPMHYGQWTLIGPRWGWVPGLPQARPVYRPAPIGINVPLLPRHNGPVGRPVAPPPAVIRTAPQRPGLQRPLMPRPPIEIQQTQRRQIEIQQQFQRQQQEAQQRAAAQAQPRHPIAAPPHAAAPVMPAPPASHPQGQQRPMEMQRPAPQMRPQPMQPSQPPARRSSGRDSNASHGRP